MITEQFKQSVAQKTRFETQRRQELQDQGQQLQDPVALQLEDEERSYRMLSETPADTILVTPAEQSHTLAPRLEEAGSSKKHREKLRSRTLKNLQEGRKEVGTMATAQTIPLMRSMKKNVKAVERQQQRETFDILKLSNITIPREIFDLNITKDHSHFDVKKALTIKAQLAKIAEYKDKNSREYALLDFDVYSKFEALLDMKEPFETTLKTVLAANGLSETGEKLPQSAIKEAREQYYAVTQSYREIITDPETMLEAKRAEIKSDLEDKLKYGKQVNDKRTKMREDLLFHWDAMASKDPEWISIPQGFFESTFFSRVVMRLDGNSEENSYPIMKSAIQAFRLKTMELAPKERDDAFNMLKKEIGPAYNDLRRKMPEMVAKLQGASLDECVGMMKDILDLELPIQHMEDIVKQCKNSEGRSIEDVLGISETEKANLKFAKQVISSCKKKVLLANAIKAAKAGVTIKYDDLDTNLTRILRGTAGPDGIIPSETVLSTLTSQLADNKTFFDGMATELTEQHLEEQREKKKIIVERKEKQSAIEQEKASHYAAQSGYINKEFGGNVGNYFSTFYSHEPVQTDVTQLYELYKSSGLVYKKAEGHSAEGKMQEGFRRMLREFFGGAVSKLDFSQEPLIANLDMGENSLEPMIEYLTHPDEEHLMEFLRPLIEFDSVGYLQRFDKETLNNPAELVRTCGQTLADAHKWCGLKQWAEVFVNDKMLSPENMKKLNFAIYKYGWTTTTVTSLGLPTGYSPTDHYELDVPAMENTLKCMEKRDEIRKQAADAADGYAAVHEPTVYTTEELKSWKLDRVKDAGLLTGKVTEGQNVTLPISREEMGKVTGADGEFLQDLAASISEFSFINEVGRARTISSSDAADLINFGAEDLAYYSEMAHKAKLIQMSFISNQAGASAALGKDAKKILDKCEMIIGVSETLSEKLKNPDRLPSYMKMKFTTYSGGTTMDDADLARQEQIISYEEKRLQQMRTEHM